MIISSVTSAAYSFFAWHSKIGKIAQQPGLFSARSSDSSCSNGPPELHFGSTLSPSHTLRHPNCFHCAVLQLLDPALRHENQTWKQLEDSEKSKMLERFLCNGT